MAGARVRSSAARSTPGYRRRPCRSKNPKYRATADGGSELVCPGFGTFRFDGRDLGLQLEQAQSRPDIQALVLNTGLPFALMMKGEILIHAAAVQTAQGAVLFAGPSGVGKSNLAALCARRGYKILADNMVRLDANQNKVYPSFPEIRVFAKDVRHYPTVAQTLKRSFTKRRMVLGSRFFSKPARLRRIYFLQTTAAALSTEKLSPRQKFELIMRNTALFGEGSPDLAAGRFARLIRLCDEVSMERLYLPHRRNLKLKNLLSL